MTEAAHVLLINGSCDQQWHQLIAQAVAAKGDLQLGSAQAVDELLARRPFRVVIIDASAVAHAPALIRRIHARQPGARVIVATAAPTWTHARAAFRAGAFDYIVKSLNREEIELAVLAAIGAVQ